MSIGDTFDVTGGTGYKVYPDKLRKAADDVQHAAELTRTFSDIDLNDIMLGPYDLGLPGTATVIMPGLSGLGTVQRYNSAIMHIVGLMHSNAAELQNLSGALATAADYYETLDEEAYEKLKREGGAKK